MGGAVAGCVGARRSGEPAPGQRSDHQADRCRPHLGDAGSGGETGPQFWATWCPPCRREIPDFVEFARTHDTNRVVVIGASIDESIEAVRSFQKSAAIPYPVVSVDGLTRLAFGGIEGVPTTFVIDAQGRFVSRTLGPMTARQLEGAMKAAQEVVSQPSTTP
jgi:thiol-disulfide isomerase/thioredoxin